MAAKRTDGSDIGPADVKDILRRHVGDASRRLRKKGTISDETIHSARKDLKRARADLRLLRNLVGKPVYIRENMALRDAARPLSTVRDAKVVIEALDELCEHDDNATQLDLLKSLRKQLDKERIAARREINSSGALVSSAEALEQAWARIDRWRVSRKRRAPLRRALARIYRQGRKALRDVSHERSPEHLHEWRKQVKYLTQAMAALNPAPAGRAAKLIKRSESVAAALGDHHDHVVLRTKIEAVHSGSHNAHRALSFQIAERTKKLESKALRQGRWLFKMKPKTFLRRLQKSL